MAKAATAKKTDLAVVGEQSKALVDANLTGDWGSEGIDSRDIIIPKVLIMQGLSKLVGDEKAVMGEIRDSVTGELLAGVGKPLEFIAFLAYKTWVVYEFEGGQWKYKQTVNFDATNANWEYEITTPQGLKVRRDLTLNYYALLPGEIENGTPFPHAMAFRRTSRQAGKKIANVAARLKMLKQPLASKVLQLVCNKVKNEKGTFYVADIQEARASTPEEIQVARQWYDTIKHAGERVVVDTSGEHEESGSDHHSTNEDNISF